MVADRAGDIKKNASRQRSLFAERALVKRHLAVAERQVEESRRRILGQRSEVAALQASGHQNSLTMRMARGLLQAMQYELATQLAERDRLRYQLKLPAAKS